MRLNDRSLGLCGLLLATLASAARVVVDWDVGYVHVDRDGSGMRRAIAVNGQLPFPPVYAAMGDTLSLTVRNSLDVTTSVHAHGLFQNGTNYMDGPAMVTQCGIPPGHSFTYEYAIQQFGTYWIHAHDHHQNADGLRTPFVVFDRNEPNRYDAEYVLALEDWYAVEFADRLNATLDPTKPFPPPPSFPNALFNGHKELPVLRFAPGKTYRLRIINMSTTEWFKFNLPGHQMRVIEADGENTHPYETDGLDMGPAQRYSVLVTAHDTDEFNYPLNATLYASFTPQIAGKNPRFYQGLIEYRTGAPTKVAPEPSAFSWLDDVKLSALSGQPPLPVDRQIEVTVSGSLFTSGQTLDVVNNITYVPPKIPSLYTALTVGELAMDPRVYGPQTNAIVLKHLEFVELKLNNPNVLPHPIHIHGHAFQIIEYGPLDSTSKEPVRGFSSAYNSPMRRDSVVIPVGHYVKIRFRADNPGLWYLHCHLDIHFAMGMAMTIVEAPDVLQKTLKVPEAMLNLCRAQGIKTWGNGAGNDGLNLAGLPTPPTMTMQSGSATEISSEH